MKFREIEKILLQDEWEEKNTRGSHRYYIHPTKPGKITIPIHHGDLDKRTIKSILKQAGL
ncbi:type II toxin-antitoxin system HicA family toxin [Jutongia sp.]